ncbi:MAG TPA: hypothetical protein VLD38_03490 [Nitrosopumilaceae archaeon]|nr:hypothetical protein [Nitrosopumilaceae archaeon]
MKKTTLVHMPPTIVLALSFCITGIGMIGYLYYSEYTTQQSVQDGDISTKFVIQNEVTEYEVTNNAIPSPMILPSKIQIIDGKNEILSVTDIFRVLWIPLLIIGSYILVHSDKSIISKVRV